MINLENVEKLRAHTGVSYEDARDALEAGKGDLLEALIYLERQGKLGSSGQSGHYKSQSQASFDREEDFGFDDKPNRFVEVLKKISNGIVYVVNKANRNSLVISRKKKEVISLPLTVVVLLLIFAFWVTLPLLVVGIFFGFRYRFSGRDMDEMKINEKMDSFKDKVSNFTDEFKEEFVEDFMEDFQRDYPKYKEEEDKKKNKDKE